MVKVIGVFYQQGEYRHYRKPMGFNHVAHIFLNGQQAYVEIELKTVLPKKRFFVWRRGDGGYS